MAQGVSLAPQACRAASEVRQESMLERSRFSSLKIAKEWIPAPCSLATATVGVGEELDDPAVEQLAPAPGHCQPSYIAPIAHSCLQALQCLEPFPSQCGPPAGPTPSRPGLVAALLPPTTAAWPPDSQPLSVSELLAVLGCTDTRGSGQVGGGVLDALDEALELELVAHWPAVRLGREKAYRTRVAAWRRQRCQEAFVAAGGMAVPGPGDELIAQALDSARGELLNECFSEQGDQGSMSSARFAFRHRS